MPKALRGPSGLQGDNCRPGHWRPTQTKQGTKNSESRLIPIGASLLGSAAADVITERPISAVTGRRTRPDVAHSWWSRAEPNIQTSRRRLHDAARPRGPEVGVVSPIGTFGLETDWTFGTLQPGYRAVSNYPLTGSRIRTDYRRQCQSTRRIRFVSAPNLAPSFNQLVLLLSQSQRCKVLDSACSLSLSTPSSADFHLWTS